MLWIRDCTRAECLGLSDLLLWKAKSFFVGGTVERVVQCFLFSVRFAWQMPWVAKVPSVGLLASSRREVLIIDDDEFPSNDFEEAPWNSCKSLGWVTKQIPRSRERLRHCLLLNVTHPSPSSQVLKNGKTCFFRFHTLQSYFRVKVWACNVEFLWRQD